MTTSRSSIGLPKWNLTIHDVAELADVSPMTVSRVINGKSGVSAEKRERITRIIGEVGFQPNLGTQRMRETCGDSVGLIFPAPIEDSPFSRELLFTGLIGLVYRVFGKSGDFVCLDLNPNARGPEENYARGLWQQRYGACIVAGPLAVDDKTIHRIHASGRPYVAFGRLDSLPGISSATVDCELGAYLSAKALIDRGHQRIALLTAYRGYQCGEDRKRGYVRALAEAGIAPDDTLIRSVAYGAQTISMAVHRILQDSGVTGLIDCTAIEDATSLREGARRAGRVIGHDVEAIIWTYTDRVPVLEEATAHLWLPVEEAVTEGMELLRDWMHGRRCSPVHVMYPPTLFEATDTHDRDESAETALTPHDASWAQYSPPVT